MKEIYKILEENEGLRDRIRKMWSKEASAQEISEAFKEAGFDIDPSKVEDALKALQAGTAEKAAMQRLDLSDLERVAGGGDGICDNTDDCDNYFKLCSTGYKSKGDRCNYFDCCDENYDRNLNCEALSM